MKNQILKLGFERIQLYENASLKKVIEAYKDYLSITQFKIELEKKVSIQNIFSNTTEMLTIKNVELPKLNCQNFMPYLDIYLVDIDKRLNKIRSNSNISLSDKIKTIAFLITECSQMEMQYYPYNKVLVFNNFEWKYESVSIPFYRLIFNKTDFEKVREEIQMRFEFFQFIKMKLELFKMRLESEKPISNHIKWKKTKRPELIITEIVLALEEKGYIEFNSAQSKTELVAELKKTFSLKDYKWSEMVSEINKRERLRYKYLRTLLKDPE